MSLYNQVCAETGLEYKVVVRQKTVERLYGTCFRGTDERLAGNFSRWDCIHDFLQDRNIEQALADEVRELWEERDFGTHSFSMEYGDVVGWSSTAPLSSYKLEDMERFDLKRKCRPLRIKLERGADIKAPQTRWITFVLEFKEEWGMPVAVVHSIYPGQDVGGLWGDVSEREGVVFFVWEHPGE